MMRSDGSHKVVNGREELVPRPSRGSNGILPNSFKTLSSYLRIVSSGASTVASTVRSAASAASAMVEKEAESCHDLVCWAGFDKIELERGITRQILLLCLSYGFQIWDVEEAENVRNLVSRHDGPVSFIQFAPKPTAKIDQSDKFAENRPLLVICADGSFSESIKFHDLRGNSHNAPAQRPTDGSFTPTVVWFYSLKTQSYVDLLRFRSAVHLVRCSPRIVAVLQSAKIHCFNAATLEIESIIDTNPITIGGYGGFGPLALGPRWLAYSGTHVSTSSHGRVSPQHLTTSVSFPSNGSLIAHFAKESSKQIAAGFVTLGDKGYKKLSRYYSDLMPDSSSNYQPGASTDPESVGMVIVRDVESQSIVAQFKAHKSPILSLCFDPSGMLLVTASVHGHNINIFLIMPLISRGSSSSVSSSSGPSYVHLYRLQRGFTNAVIQDISFSSDSQWILISSSRGTSHLFSISPPGGPTTGVQVLSEQMMSASSSPVTLNAVSRIRNGGNVWMNAVAGAVAGRSNHPISATTIASVFHNCGGGGRREDISGLRKDCYLLVYSPLGSVIQYVLRTRHAGDGARDFYYESEPDSDGGVVVDAVQKWNISRKQNQIMCEDFVNMYSNIGRRDSRTYLDGIERESNVALFISESEVCLRRKKSQFWAKTEIYLYAVSIDALNVDGGEVEIENVPVRMVVSRSMGSYQNPRFQQGRFGEGISSDSLSLGANGGTIIANESNESSEEKGNDGLQSLLGNDSSSPTTRLDGVICTREDHMGDDNQLRSVNNIDGIGEEFAEGG